jgi:hypothetical protein
VVRALQQAGHLDRIAPAVGLGDHVGGAPPRLLLWGAAAPGPDATAVAAAGVLADISVDLGELPDRRSEPDVIVLWDDVVVVIEAKLKAANDRQTKDLYRFDRYLRRPDRWTASPDLIRKSGLYELVRNWVIACELAERIGADHAVLANLAPAALAGDMASFRALVATSPKRRVAHVRWRSLLADPSPDWLERHATRLALRDV